MISKEQIAHDLTMVYMKNRYGPSVDGIIAMTDGAGSGTVSTDHFPSTTKIKYRREKTGEKGFLGIEKKKRVESGHKVDDLFNDMVEDYTNAYIKFLKLLEQKES